MKVNLPIPATKGVIAIRWTARSLAAVGIIIWGFASVSRLCAAGIPDATRPISVVAFYGQIAPGTGGARIASLSQGMLNNVGQIGFSSDLTGGSAAKGAFLYSHGQISPIALQGQAAPGGSPGLTFRAFSAPFVNDSGDAVFVAFVSDSGPTVYAVYLFSGNQLTKVADSTMSAPGAPGRNFYLFRSPQINNRGDIVFEADLDSSPPLNGLWMVSGGVLKPVVLGTDMIPGTGQTFGSILDSFSLNNLGDVAFADYTGNGPNGIFLYSQGSITPAVVGSPAVPNSSLVLNLKENPCVNDRREIVFVNNYFVSGPARSSAPNALVLWKSGNLQKIAMMGDPVPQFGNAVIGNDLGDVRINNNGVISFRIRVYPSSGETPEAIFTVENGKWNFIVSEGDTLTDIGRFDFLGEVILNDRGVMTFVSNMTGGSFGLFTVGALPYRYFLPQVANGTSDSGSWRTTSILANHSTSPATASVSYWSDDGTPLSLTIQGQTSSQFTYTIPPEGSLRVQTDGAGSQKTGWALVQSDQALSGIALYAFFDSGGNFVDEAGAPFSLDFGSMSIFAENQGNTYTGLALANPNSTGATVTLTLKDSQSAVVATTQFNLAANGHVAKYLTEFFTGANIPASFQGTVDIMSTQPLSGLTLRQHNSDFTSLPIIP
ncbi:MAG TPA: choice-of-anchor tandem repeat NxxGxxAF-containing protein [Acidobacteriota bacterium]|nr:choice-of-anchor tandem repeat NxxGxxAF-containing protein [Acidobacteriota bacterium]